MKDEKLEITEKTDNGICKFTAKGCIDSNSAEVLLFKLDNAFNEGKINIILNMAMVDYLSSIGIRVILKIYKQAAEAGGSFSIENPSEIVKNVLGMVALKDMLVTC
jgi:anti-sigma B factor antagonist